MAKTIGLPDTIRGHLGLAATIVLVVQSYLLTQTITGNPQVPDSIIWAIGLIAAVLVAVRDYGGVRDASTARIAKETSGSLEQFRAVPEQKTVRTG